MTQNASTREETADLQPEDAFFKFTEAIRDNSSRLVLVRPRMLHCTPAAGTAEHQGLHNQIRCFSGCGSQASYCVGIRSNGTLLRPPAQAPIACTVPSAQTAFHFIQIKFKRCNVRCSVARYYLTRPEPICQIGRLYFVRCLTFFFVQF